MVDLDWTQPGRVQPTATACPASVQPAASQRSTSVQPMTYTRPASVQPTSRQRQKCWTFNGPYCIRDHSYVQKNSHETMCIVQYINIYKFIQLFCGGGTSLCLK